MQTKCLLPGLILAFCAATSLFSVAAERRSSPQSNHASVTLWESASQQLEAGQVDQAAATLERALHIEPNNPVTLHYLGEVRFRQGQYQQAEALAARSNIGAGSNVELRNGNIKLIQASQQAQASGIPAGSEEDLAAVQESQEENVARRRETEIAAAEQPAPETEEESAAFAPAQAEWESESRMVGSPRPEGEFQMTASEPEPEFDAMDIPRGHWPPPGKCRIWFPDRPPGHQPAPGSCKKLKHRVPFGAYLVGG